MSFLSTLFGKKKKKEDIPVSQASKEPKTEVSNQKSFSLPSGTTPTLPKEPVQRDTTAWKPGDVILEHYDVEDVITSGGMGTVYITNHRNWKVKVAIKSPTDDMLSHPSYFQRVIREAEAWTELGLHPNIAYCYFVRNIEDVPHIFVEYVDGGDLRKWIEGKRCADLRIGLDMAIQFCHGMVYAHSKGMIHRDIKPSNILMTKDGTLKVTDFGITKVERTEEELSFRTTDFTKTRGVLGTIAYASPEQLRDAHSVGPESDVYSFGVCLWEMFLGRRPRPNAWNDDPLPDTKTIDSSLPDALARILTEMVDLDRNTRIAIGGFDSMKERLKALYNDLFHEPSPHSELEQVDLEADSLNNRGVSYLALENEQEAIKCFEEALKKNAVHPEAVYNSSLMKWRAGEITDAEVLIRLDNCGSNPEIEKKNIAELKAYIRQESFNPHAARGILQEYPGKYDDLFLGRESSQIGMIRTLEGHTDSVNSVAITPDSRHAVSGSRDGTLRVWEIKTGRCLRTMEGHTREVHSVAITPDGRHAVSGNRDNTLRVWKIETGHCLGILEGHTSWVLSIAITPDGRHAVSGSNDTTLRVWEIETGQCLRTMEGHTREVHSVAITPDGRHAISASLDKTLRVWELETGRCLRTMEGHADSVNSVAITPDGRHAVSASRDETLRVWKIKTGQCLRALEEHISEVNSVAITPDGRHAISGSWDGTQRMWEIETGRCLRALEEHHTGVDTSVAITPDSRYAVSGSYDNTLTVWKIGLQKAYRSPYMVSKPKNFRDHKEEADALNRAVAHARDLYSEGNYSGSYSILYDAWEKTAFCSKEAITRLYADLIKRGKIAGLHFSHEARILKMHRHFVTSVAITPDGCHAILGSGDKTLRVWEIETGRCLRTMEGHTGLVYSVAITPDGRHAVSGSRDKTLRVWEIETGRCLHTMKGHEGDVHSVAITPDGCHAVSGSLDNTLRVWEFETGLCLRAMKAYTNGVLSVAITPDGRHAVSGSWDGTLRMWEIETGRCLHVMEGHTDVVTSVAITPDGCHAISGSLDNTLMVWEIETGLCLRAMDVYTKGVLSTAITPDGRYAVSGNRNNTLMVWEIETGRLLHVMEGHVDVVTTVAITPDSCHAVSGSGDRTLRLWRFIWGLEFTGEDNADKGGQLS